MAWKLIVRKKKSGPPVYQLTDGTTTFNVADGAKFFRDEDAADGIEVTVERGKSGQPTKVTIPGKQEVAPSPGGARVGGGRRDGPRPEERRHAGGRGRGQSQGQQRNDGRGGYGGGQRGGSRPPRKERPPLRNAKAPYNFVTAAEPLTFPIAEGPRYSGVLVCRGTALTPLLIASPVHGRAGNASAERRFFEVAGRPVIPGSSLKGLLRTGVETLTRSTLAGFVSDTTIAFRDVGTLSSAYSHRFKGANDENRLRAGFLVERGADRSIVPCEYLRVQLPALGLKRIRGSAAEITSNALSIAPHLTVAFSLGGNTDPAGTGIAEHPRFDPKGSGRLVATGWMPGRRGTEGKTKGYIFHSRSADEEREIEDRVWRNFEDQLTRPQEELLKLLRNKGLDIPVFYLVEDGTITAIGLSRYFRICAAHAPRTLAGTGSNGEATGADIPRQIFGSIEPSSRGRVRVTAGNFGQGMQPRRFPPEGALVAGNPAASAVAMYLVQDSGKTRYVASYNTGRNEDLVTYDSSHPVLRGRKFYWHRHVPAAPHPPNDNQNVQSVYYPLSQGSEFAFTVGFERLSAVELGALLESLVLPEGHAHKLGLGKPFGLGSVRLEVDWANSTIDDVRERYSSLRRRLERLAGSGQLAGHEEKAKLARAAFRAAVEEQTGAKPGTFETLGHVADYRCLTSWVEPPDPRSIQYMPLSQAPEPTYATKAILPNPCEVSRVSRKPSDRSAPS